MAFGDNEEDIKPMTAPLDDSPEVEFEKEEEKKDEDFFTFDAQEDEGIAEDVVSGRDSNPYAQEAVTHENVAEAQELAFDEQVDKNDEAEAAPSSPKSEHSSDSDDNPFMQHLKEE